MPVPSESPRATVLPPIPLREKVNLFNCCGRLHVDRIREGIEGRYRTEECSGNIEGRR